MPDQIQEFVGQCGVTYPVGAEPENGISDKYGVYRIPTSFLFGPDGRLYHRFDGFTTGAPFEKEIEELLNREH